MFVQKKSKSKSTSSGTTASLIQPLATNNRANQASNDTSKKQTDDTKASNSALIGPDSFQPFKSIQAKSKTSTTTNPTQKKEQVKPDNQSNNNTGMPDQLKAGLEHLSGKDLSGVRVHRNSSKPDAIQAYAYTQGQDIHLASGQEKHLPHEGWHVVQQMQGRVKPTIQQKSALINDDSGLEREADVMGEKAVQMHSTNDSTKTTDSVGSDNNGVIQRAMKFEYQFKGNFINLDNGTEVHRLPRKYGPRDYLIHDNSGARLETETNGQIEYETDWEKKWPKLFKQVQAIQDMSKTMDNEPETELGSNGKKYRKFPASWDIQHLQANAGFSVSSENNRWNTYQKDGDAIVKSSTEEYENFRSTPVYDKTDGNLIGKINNNEKVFIHYKSSDGKWSRIEYEGTLGWMWSASLTGTESKKYEQSNDDNLKNKTDKPLGKGAKLLVEVTDSSWSPYTQISESFELEQYESYLTQYDKVLAPILIPNAEKLILEHNSQIAPNGETQAEKDLREKAFLNDHNKLKNLLLMVSQYVEKGRSQTTMANGKPGSAKYALNLMSRTHFGSIFKSMTYKEQLLFTQIVKDKTNGIVPKMGLTTTSLFFMDGTGTGYNPTVYAWLLSITTGGDILSTRSEFGSKLPGAMGKYKIEEEKGMNEGLVRFEARNEPDNFPLLDDLDDHALRHFNSAMTNRPRATGKNGTGLES